MDIVVKGQEGNSDPIQLLRTFHLQVDGKGINHDEEEL